MVTVPRAGPHRYQRGNYTAQPHLARDRTGLAEYRRTLRGRLVASPAANPVTYARAVEEAYRMLWRNWCATGKPCP